MSDETITGEEPRVRVVTPPYESGKRHEIVRDEWIELDGLTTGEEITDAIREAMGSDDWEIIQTDNLPTGIQTDPDTLAEYVEAAAAADLNGVPAAVFLAACEDQGMTVDPDTIHYYGEGFTDSDIAGAVVESVGNLREAVGEDALERYFDWEAFGRDLRLGDGFQIVDGMIFQVQ